MQQHYSSFPFYSSPSPSPPLSPPPFPPVSPPPPAGSKRWTGRERQQFRHAWRVHRKQFQLIRSALENKLLPEVIEYYYSWKKYCNDEYRGRNRHISEEVSACDTSSSHTLTKCTLPPLPPSHITHFHTTPHAPSFLPPPPQIMSEEDETGGRPPSAASTSSGSSASGELEQQQAFSQPRRGASIFQQPLPPELMEHLPRAFVPGLNHPPIQEHRCKYPGCNQVGHLGAVTLLEQPVCLWCGIRPLHQREAIIFYLHGTAAVSHNYGLFVSWVNYTVQVQFDCMLGLEISM